MKFAISSDQRDYFRKNGFIPFTSLLKEGEVKTLNAGVEEALAALKPNFEAGDSFKLGRDLWRSNADVKKIVFSKRLIDLAFELNQKKPIRLAFDQLLPEKSLYKQRAHYSLETATFQEHSCITDLQGVFLICIKKLSSSSNEIDMEEGDGYFLLPSVPFPFISLTPSSTHRFFLIAYGGPYSQYILEERDPQTHFLKSIGYVFGDKLNDRLHPILLR